MLWGGGQNGGGKAGTRMRTPWLAAGEGRGRVRPSEAVVLTLYL